MQTFNNLKIFAFLLMRIFVAKMEAKRIFGQYLQMALTKIYISDIVKILNKSPIYGTMVLWEVLFIQKKKEEENYEKH